MTTFLLVEPQVVVVTICCATNKDKVSNMSNLVFRWYEIEDLLHKHDIYMNVFVLCFCVQDW